MLCDLNAKLLFDSLLDFHEPRVAILQHLAGLQIHKMVVLAEFVRTLVLGAVVAELVLDHQVAVQKQLDGVVQSGATHSIFAVFHPVVKFLDVEMAI